MRIYQNLKTGTGMADPNDPGDETERNKSYLPVIAD